MKAYLILFLFVFSTHTLFLSAENADTARENIDSISSNTPLEDSCRANFTKPERQNTATADYLKQSIAPLSLASASLGIMAIPSLKYDIQKQLNWNKAEIITLYDDQLRYLPTAVMAGLSLVGVKGKHNIWEQILLSGATYVLSDFFVFRLKEATKVARPSPFSGNESFPSQHTAQAFLAATLLHKEFGYISPWISIGGYAAASWVGYARIARNRHFMSDVLMGSAIGIVSANLSYWAYDLIPKKRKNTVSMLPVVSKNEAELLFVYNFR